MCEDCGVQIVFGQLRKLIGFVQTVVSDVLQFGSALLRSRTALAAENLFLRKQLALFREREKKATRTKAADRFILARLARLFDWRNALVIVKPATLISAGIELPFVTSGAGGPDLLEGLL